MLLTSLSNTITSCLDLNVQLNRNLDAKELRLINNIIVYGDTHEKIVVLSLVEEFPTL